MRTNLTISHNPVCIPLGSFHLYQRVLTARVKKQDLRMHLTVDMHMHVHNNHVHLTIIVYGMRKTLWFILSMAK